MACTTLECALLAVLETEKNRHKPADIRYFIEYTGSDLLIFAASLSRQRNAGTMPPSPTFCNETKSALKKVSTPSTHMSLFPHNHVLYNQNLYSIILTFTLLKL